MARTPFGSKGVEGDYPAPSSGSSGSGGLSAFIDQGSEFEGKLVFKDTVRIDGRFRGEISSENTLIVGESGSVTATIKSQVVIISGEVHGDINASGQVVLHKTARVDGNIHSPRLAMEDGAAFTGRVEMGHIKPSKPVTMPKDAGQPGSAPKPS